MSWLLFMDESGHDHRSMPYEVRGGVAIQDRLVWPFILAVNNLEQDCFGVRLSEFKKEFKGEKLLDKNRFEWAEQDRLQDDEVRRKNVRAWLSKGLQKVQPNRHEFTAYGQACLKMAHGIFRLLKEHQAHIFACAIPKGTRAPNTWEAAEYLRKDHVYLLQRFYNFAKGQQEQGLLVMDQVDPHNDIRFVRKLERYFVRTVEGPQRADWIVPAPFFSSSYLSVPIQSADVCIYCINWGYRKQAWGMNAETRKKIEDQFAGWIDQLVWRGKTIKSDGSPKTLYSIVFVRNPYGSGEP